LLSEMQSVSTSESASQSLPDLESKGFETGSVIDRDNDMDRDRGSEMVISVW
jgi:hypothetical protein